MTPASTPQGFDTLGDAFDAVEEEPLFEPEPVADEDLYWAARSVEKVVDALKEHEDRFFGFAERRGYVEMWQQAAAEFYGMTGDAFSFGLDAANIGFDGADGELIKFRFAHMRSFIRQAVTRATKERPAFQTTAMTADSKSLESVDTVDQAAETAYQRGVGEERERLLVERAEVCAKTWGWARWDPDAGPFVTAPGQMPDGSPSPVMQRRRSGSHTVRILNSWDVIHDPTIEDEDDIPWHMAREKRSRWEVLAWLPKDDPEYDEKRDAIKGASPQDEIAFEALFGFNAENVNDDDVIPKWFYPPPMGDDLPDGRMLVVCGGKAIFDGPWRGYPQADVPQTPFVSYKHAEMLGTGLGYSDAWDLVVLQKMLTQLISDCATNIVANGRSLVVADEGLEVTEQQLANGMSILRKPVGSEAPGSINLSQLPDATQWFIGLVMQQFMAVMGENEVSRGNPSDNVKSGTMAALFDAMAVERGHAREAALNRWREKMVNLLLAITVEHADAPQVIETVGDGGRYEWKQYASSALQGFQLVRVKPTDAKMKSHAYRAEALQVLSKIPGAIENPAQAIELYTTGQWKQIFKGPQANLHRIARENEALRAGTPIAPGMPSPDDMPGQPPPLVTPDLPVFWWQNHLIEVKEQIGR